MAKKITLSDGTEITMREPKVKDMRLAAKDNSTPGDIELAMIANLTGVTLEELDEYSLKDYSLVQGALMGFQK